MADDSLDLSRYPAPSELVPIASLTPDPTNARNHTANDARSIKALMKSLEKFGQRKPIVVDADGIVRAGNGLMEAAAQLGWTHISITRADALKGAEAMEYALYDNRTAETSSWDNAILAAQLQEYASLGEGIPEPLWSNEELLAVQALSAVTAEEIDMPTLAAGDRAPIQQMTFTLHDDQAESVRAALDVAKELGPFVDTGNENSNGNALARVCELFMGQHGHR